jgi:hypothetical protein
VLGLVTKFVSVFTDDRRSGVSGFCTADCSFHCDGEDLAFRSPGSWRDGCACRFWLMGTTELICRVTLSFAGHMRRGVNVAGDDRVGAMVGTL